MDNAHKDEINAITRAAKTCAMINFCSSPTEVFLDYSPHAGHVLLRLFKDGWKREEYGYEVFSAYRFDKSHAKELNNVLDQLENDYLKFTVESGLVNYGA